MVRVRLWFFDGRTGLIASYLGEHMFRTVGFMRLIEALFMILFPGIYYSAICLPAPAGLIVHGI